MNRFDELRDAVGDAHDQIKAVDAVVSSMASMIAGRLRKANVSHGTLTALKKELADFNIHTNKWKTK